MLIKKVGKSLMNRIWEEISNLLLSWGVWWQIWPLLVFILSTFTGVELYGLENDCLFQLKDDLHNRVEVSQWPIKSFGRLISILKSRSGHRNVEAMEERAEQVKEGMEEEFVFLFSLRFIFWLNKYCDGLINFIFISALKSGLILKL